MGVEDAILDMNVITGGRRERMIDLRESFLPGLTLDRPLTSGSHVQPHQALFSHPQLLHRLNQDEVLNISSCACRPGVLLPRCVVSRRWQARGCRLCRDHLKII